MLGTNSSFVLVGDGCGGARSLHLKTYVRIPVSTFLKHEDGHGAKGLFCLGRVDMNAVFDAPSSAE